MRAALVRAAQASPGDVSDLILKADRNIKTVTSRGWSVDRAKKRGGKRGRRNRT